MRNYVDNNLIPGEAVAFETTYHWIIFFHWRSLLMLFIAPALACWSDEFTITNHHITVKVGLISRRTLEMNLNKVETVNVDQSILGRMLGYGTIRIVGTGGTNEVFENISHPIDFRKKFLELSM
jgi:uncharacterized membrane protein YdbT with pleckstrin-like domain